MKKILIIFFIVGVLFAKEYSIIAFSTKTFNEKAAKLFIKRFPNGIVKQYTKFVEYKIEPFKSYKEAKEFLKKVKKYYKYPLIIPYNPYLGKILYPLTTTKTTKQKPKKIKIEQTNDKLVYCKSRCGCHKDKPRWEINNSKVLSDINVSVKEYLTKPKEKNETKTALALSKSYETNETNETQAYSCKYPDSSDYMFYFDVYGNIYTGQEYKHQLYGDGENIKLGFIYERYFWDFWKFYTDDRIILSRSNSNGNINTDLYLDVNELYIRSFCINCDLTNILIGRKKTKDFRSWWYDESLDQIKLFSEHYLFNYELIFAKRFDNDTITDDNSPKARLKGSKFLIFHTNYEYKYRNNFDFYYIYEDSRPKDLIQKRRISFVGIGFDGFYKDVFYWLNAGYSKGNIEKIGILEKSKGYGFDIGAKFKASSRLSLAASYAFGSGGNDYFTQPILATDNSDYLHKNFSFKYYGYIMDPVLENLHILSFYGIYDFNEYKALIAALHLYRQDVAQSVVYNDKYLFATNGQDKEVGSEIDVIYQYLNTRYEKLKVGIGYFIGSKAYNYLKYKNAYRIFVNYRRYWK